MLHYLWTAPAIGFGTALEAIGGTVLNAGIFLQAHGRTKNLEASGKIQKADDNVACVKVALHTQRYHDTIDDYEFNEERAKAIAELIAKKQ